MASEFPGLEIQTWEFYLLVFLFVGSVCNSDIFMGVFSGAAPLEEYGHLALIDPVVKRSSALIELLPLVTVLGAQAPMLVEIKADTAAQASVIAIDAA